MLRVEAVQAQEKAESVWHEPELQKQPEKWTEPRKELSQERQPAQRHADLHQVTSSPSFQALTRFSFPSSLSEDTTKNREARSHGVLRSLPLVNKFQETLLETSMFGQQEEVQALAPAS